VLYVDGTFKVNDNRLRLLYGAGATGGESFVQGAATGVGSAALSFPSALRKQTTAQYNLNYRYNLGAWRAEMNASFGRDRVGLRDIRGGLLADANANLASRRPPVRATSRPPA